MLLRVVEGPQPLLGQLDIHLVARHGCEVSEQQSKEDKVEKRKHGAASFACSKIPGQNNFTASGRGKSCSSVLRPNPPCCGRDASCTFASLFVRLPLVADRTSSVLAITLSVVSRLTAVTGSQTAPNRL